MTASRSSLALLLLLLTGPAAAAAVEAAALPAASASPSNCVSTPGRSCMSIELTEEELWPSNTASRCSGAAPGTASVSCRVVARKVSSFLAPAASLSRVWAPC